MSRWRCHTKVLSQESGARLVRGDTHHRGDGHLRGSTNATLNSRVTDPTVIAKERQQFHISGQPTPLGKEHRSGWCANVPRLPIPLDSTVLIKHNPPVWQRPTPGRCSNVIDPVLHHDDRRTRVLLDMVDRPGDISDTVMVKHRRWFIQHNHLRR